MKLYTFVSYLNTHRVKEVDAPAILLWVGLWCVIVVLPDHTHLMFTSNCIAFYRNEYN